MILFNPNHPRAVPLKEIFCERCNCWDAEPCWSHVKKVPDRVVLPYAIASLPPVLYLAIYPGLSTSFAQAIFAEVSLERQTLFGPLVGPLADTVKECKYALKDATNRKIHRFQLENDKLSNWMKFVRFAENPEEQNVAVYSRGGQVYFVTTRRIAAKEELKVGYSKKYATCFVTAPTDSQKNLPPRPDTPGNFAADENVNLSNAVGGLDDDVLLDSCLPEVLPSDENVTENHIPVAETSFLPTATDLPVFEENRKVWPPKNLRKTDHRKPKKRQQTSETQPTVKKPIPPHPLAAGIVLTPPANLIENVFLPNSLPADVLSDPPSTDGPNILATQSPCDSDTIETCTDAQTAADLNSEAMDLEEIRQADKFRRYQEKQKKWIHPREACPVCGIMVSKTSLMTHLRDQHEQYCEENFKFECLHCDTVWPNERAVKHHTAVVHPHLKLPATFTRDAAAIQEAIEHVKATGYFTFYCHYCRQYFPMKSLFDLHKLRHRGNEPLEDRPDRDCPCCRYVAQNFADLVEHSIHHSLPYYAAKPCMFCSEAVIDVKEHIMEHHSQIFEDITKDWAFRCEQCGSRFLSGRRLVFHMRIHTGLQCLYCAKQFDETRKLSTHSLVHKVDDRFPCPHCRKLYPTYPRMRVHYRDMHDVTSMRQCDICEKVLKSKPAWVLHMKKFHSAGEPDKKLENRKRSKNSGDDGVDDGQGTPATEGHQQEIKWRRKPTKAKKKS